MFKHLMLSPVSLVCLVIVMMTLVLPGVVRGQDGLDQVDLPFFGVVVPERAELRAGPGKAYYTVGSLESESFVEVHEGLLGWYKITAPRDVYSYVSKAFVKASGDGTAGVIDGDRVQVKAASEKGPGWSFKPQTTLDRGTEVMIVSEEGSFYKIVAPEAARVFISRDAVRIASPGEVEQHRRMLSGDEGEVAVAVVEAEAVVSEVAVEVREASPEVAVDEPEMEPIRLESVTPASEAEVEVQVSRPLIPVEPESGVAVETAEAAVAVVPEMEADVPATSEAEVVAVPAPESEEWAVIGKDAVGVSTEVESTTLQSVEKEMRPKFSLPLDEMPIDEMVAAYEALRDAGGLSAQDLQVIEIRLIALERNRQLLAAMLNEPVVPVIVETEPAPVVGTQRVPAAEVEDYTYVGVLMQSSLYNGQAGRPSLLRLVDPTTRRTLGYIVTRKVSDRRAISSLVGIVGKDQRDVDLGIRLIEPEQVDILSVRP
ncbi:MAG: SH3 domain-containing protein [Phycisphaeraceae bacterium]